MRKTLATTALAVALVAPAGVAQAASSTDAATPAATATTVTKTETKTKTEDDKTGLWGLLGLLGLAGLMRKKQPEVRTADHVRTYDRDVHTTPTTTTTTTTDRTVVDGRTDGRFGDGDGRLDADDFRTNGR